MQTAQKIIDTTVREIEQTDTPTAIDTAAGKVEQASTIAQELIAQLAYEKWQQRGCPIGDELQDWFAAQTELEVEALAGVDSDIERMAS